MNCFLWIGQAILSLVFCSSAYWKHYHGYEHLADQYHWVSQSSPEFIRLISHLEFCGGVGIILPEAFGVMVWLTPVAGAGLTLLMIGAMITQYLFGDLQGLLLCFCMIIISGWVTYGRIKLSNTQMPCGDKFKIKL